LRRHSHHRTGQNPRLFPRAKTQNAGCGFFAAADQPLSKVPAFAGKQLDQIAAVVNDEVRTAGEGFDQQLLVFLPGDTVHSEGLHT
jgi:hypothetical protein